MNRACLILVVIALATVRYLNGASINVDCDGPEICGNTPSVYKEDVEKFTKNNVELRVRRGLDNQIQTEPIYSGDEDMTDDCRAVTREKVLYVIKTNSSSGYKVYEQRINSTECQRPNRSCFGTVAQVLPLNLETYCETQTSQASVYINKTGEGMVEKKFTINVGCACKIREKTSSSEVFKTI